MSSQTSHDLGESIFLPLKIIKDNPEYNLKFVYIVSKSEPTNVRISRTRKYWEGESSKNNVSKEITEELIKESLPPIRKLFLYFLEVENQKY